MVESTDVTNRERLYTSAAISFLFLLVGGLFLGIGLGLGWAQVGYSNMWRFSLFVGGLMVIYSSILYWETVAKISVVRRQNNL